MNPFLLYLEYMVKLGDAIDKSPYGPYWRAYWRMMGDPVRDFWNDNARETRDEKPEKHWLEGSGMAFRHLRPLNGEGNEDNANNK